MIGTILAVSLLATSPGPLRIAAPGLGSLNLSEQEAAYFSDALANRLAEQPGLSVVKASDIGTALGLERQRELLGCSESGSSCAVEIAQALGVDAILTGSIGRFGDTYQVDARLISAKDGSLLASDSGQATGETDLLERLADAAQALAEKAPRPANASIGVVAKSQPSVARDSGGLRGFAWIPAAAAVGAFGGSAYFAVQAGQRHDALVRGDPIGLEAAQGVQRDGLVAQDRARIAAGVGGALLVGAGVMFLLGGGEQAEVTTTTQLAVGANASGWSVGVAGVLP